MQEGKRLAPWDVWISWRRYEALPLPLVLTEKSLFLSRLNMMDFVKRGATTKFGERFTLFHDKFDVKR